MTFCLQTYRVVTNIHYLFVLFFKIRPLNMLTQIQPRIFMHAKVLKMMNASKACTFVYCCLFVQNL